MLLVSPEGTFIIPDIEWIEYIFILLHEKTSFSFTFSMLFEMWGQSSYYLRTKLTNNWLRKWTTPCRQTGGISAIQEKCNLWKISTKVWSSNWNLFPPKCQAFGEDFFYHVDKQMYLKISLSKFKRSFIFISVIYRSLENKSSCYFCK